MFAALFGSIGWIVAALIVIAATYVTAAIALGAFPVNAAFTETPDGVPIYLRTNGVHAELILPTRAGSIDWSIDHPPAHMRSLSEPLKWVAFGWGDRGFFASTPTWADLRPTTALKALSGIGPGAMHVEYIESPRMYKAREVKINAEQYARLVAFIRASFERDAAGRPHRTSLPGYFSTDAFYDSSVGYKFWFTCNEWVRKALSDAGVRTAAWAPFDTALFYQLEKINR
ncbi:MAG TPA: TIGR02117 family protein [Burkholderiaceae bacterium]|nr:TIGR02117 family protein [Burkholderiaceae bacterium]